MPHREDKKDAFNRKVLEILTRISDDLASSRNAAKESFDLRDLNPYVEADPCATSSRESMTPAAMAPPLAKRYGRLGP